MALSSVPDRSRVGIVATMLFVPDEGRKTRSRIAHLTGRTADALNNGARSLEAKTGDLFRKGNPFGNNKRTKGEKQ